jgi:hypothetical protein
MKRQGALLGGYQEALRVVGAWLDVRGMHTVRIVEDEGELLIEASNSNHEDSAASEQFRLDRESIERLTRAARHDRGVTMTRSILVHNGDGLLG